MSDWNLVILHYHLNPGGVTRVIDGHLQALTTLAPSDQPVRVAVCFDGQADQWRWEPAHESCRFELEQLVVPSLRYDTDGCCEPASLSEALRSALADAELLPEETLIHVHNHNLGKNAALPSALRRLAQAGYRLLLQIHDFAEDIRPTNYRHMADCYGGTGAVPQQIYFHAEHVHYAVLNQRDARVLQAAGLPHDHLHSLPNPVNGPARHVDPDEARAAVERQWPQAAGRQFLVYPVRGIRRKNVGELLLWAAACRESAFFSMTLPPRNPIEQPIYERWKSLAEQLELPVDLAAATHPSVTFEELISAADWEITTSVAEGFGLVFLESWLAGKPLVGRDLPDITRDFKEAGVVFSYMQAELAIPWDWLDRKEVAHHLFAHYRDVLDAYAVERSLSSINREIDLLLDGPFLDWAYLDVELQHRLLSELPKISRGWDAFWHFNPLISRFRNGRIIDSERLAELVESNATTTRTQFGLHACGRRLYDVYARLLASTATPAVEPLPHVGAVLEFFLRLDRIHPIRLA